MSRGYRRPTVAGRSGTNEEEKNNSAGPVINRPVLTSARVWRNLGDTSTLRLEATEGGATGQKRRARSRRAFGWRAKDEGRTTKDERQRERQGRAQQLKWKRKATQIREPHTLGPLINHNRNITHAAYHWRPIR